MLSRAHRGRRPLLTALFLSAGLFLALVTPCLAVTHAVSINNDEFDPRFITIAPGDTVLWTNRGGDHTVIADDGSFSSTAAGETSIPFGQTFSHTFPEAGRWP